MSTAEVQATPKRFNFPWNLVLFLVTAAYAVVYLRWYGTTPLGVNPVLDGSEILSFAKRIASGDLGPDPFFVPPLYPALLSLSLQAGLSDSLLPLAARGLNLGCHLISTLCVAYLARRVWRSRRCGFAGGLLWGLNPVALHFAGDPLPENLAVCLLLLGACGAARMVRRTGPHLVGTLICAGFWSLAALTVPQGIVLVLLCPVLALVISRGAGNKLAATLLATLIGATALLGLGYANQRISGQFQVTPLQNTYEFWAANRPGSHGRFPQRLVAARSFDDPVQSARIESERLYAQQNPRHPTNDYAEIDRFWRGQIWDYIRNSSGRFANHLSDKLLYLFNNFEQYDNKTYSLHKQRSPWLAFNPLCWGILLVLAGAGVPLAWQRRLTRATVTVFVFYAMIVIAFFVSARARLPLVPFLAVLSGWVGRPKYQFSNAEKRSVIAASVTALVLGLITFVPLPEEERTETIIFDHIVMAGSATEVGDYLLAVRHAEAARQIQQHSALALETLCLTRFRHWQSILPEQPSVNTMRDTVAACQNAVRLLESHRAEIIAALYLWKLGDRNDAREIWYRMADSASEYTETALQALIITGQTRGKDQAWLDSTSRKQMSTPLLAALTLVNDRSARNELETRLRAKQRQSLLNALHAQFSTSVKQDPQ